MTDNGHQMGRMDALMVRAEMLQAIRSFFSARGYLEVETPNRIPAPAPETHIDAFPSADWFLHTSPELCMKRLLAGGHSKIFQICKCFRAGERGALHLPEFTLLEWYDSGMDYHALMAECEQLLFSVSLALGHRGSIHWRDKTLSLQVPWERLTVTEAFQRYAPLSMTEALDKGQFDVILASYIEPHLGHTGPVFLYDYPTALGALARTKKDHPDLAERFEIYIAGIELANGFSELTDVREQRRRFDVAQEERRQQGKSVYPEAERFLQDLNSMPESAGIALGIDRLAMLFTGSITIDRVVTFTPENL